MAKIGRNQPCPCGSGKKYKHCCIGKYDAAPAAAAPQQAVSVRAEVTRLQEAAAQKKQVVQVVGVFVFFANSAGDAWLLELTEKDALLVAKGGRPLEVEIDEGGDTIEINWSHQFTIDKSRFVTTAYADKAEEVHEEAPVRIIREAFLQIQKSFSSSLLDSIHVA